VKILHVLTDLNTGGAERMVVQLASDAAARGDDVTVACEDGQWVPELEKVGVHHVRVTLMRRSMTTTLVAGAQLAPVIRRVAPDVVHTHNVRATLAARVAMSLAFRRCVLMPTVHGLAPDDYRSAARVLGLVARRVVACAPSVAASLAAAGLSADRIDVITNGAGLDPATPERTDALRRQLAVGNAPLVVGMGRLAEQKDWPTFIEALSRLDDVEVVVAGEGGLRSALEDRARQLGGRVRFVGGVSDVAALLGLATCVVSTSTWEGLPLSLLEALSLGVPAVATAVDGVTDLVPPDAALLVEPGQPDQVEASVSRLLADDKLRRRLGSTAHEASRQWSAAKMLETYRAAYEAATSGLTPWVGAQDPRSRTDAASSR
jgi:glycosyltransferase involved in cell wall biosynthesis